MKLLRRATLFDCVAAFLSYAIIGSIVFWITWMLMRTLPPGLLIYATFLSAGLLVTGVMKPSKNGFGALDNLGTAAGCTVALTTICSAPASEFFFSFVILLTGVSLGESIGIWRLKKKGYSETPEAISASGHERTWGIGWLDTYRTKGADVPPAKRFWSNWYIKNHAEDADALRAKRFWSNWF